MGRVLTLETGLHGEREFRFTEEDFHHIRDLVSQYTGIALSESKQEMVYSRLSRRLRLRGLESFAAYCDLLQAGDDEELGHFVNAITTNLTSFFREAHHFDYLATTLLPMRMGDKGRARRLRLWSAGCSTGEEPYSLAITIKEALPAASHWNVKILATDLDSNALASASAGIYREEQVKQIAAPQRHRWFKKGTGSNTGLVRVSPDLQELITFRRLNLMHTWPMRGPFDVIFCRNVVIYFDKETQRVLFDRYADLLDRQGYLFIGHSENLTAVTDRFEALGQTIYRKRH